MRSAHLAVVLAVALTGCASSASPITSAQPTSTAVADGQTSTNGQATATKPFEVKTLGLKFGLTPAFSAVQDPSFVFLARSLNPRAVFSIDNDTPADVASYKARPGESISTINLDGVNATVVTHAAIEGLPSGIDANELLVANAARSFSVIMSAASADLSTLWQTFVGTISIQPA